MITAIRSFWVVPRRRVFAVFALWAILALSLPAQGQSNEDVDAAAEDVAGSADVMAAAEPTAPALDLEAIVALDLSSYETAWVRYLNSTSIIWRLLDIEGISQYPFRFVNTASATLMEDLHDLERLESLIEEYDFHYDEDAIIGICDTLALEKYGTTDILCKPGTKDLEPGFAVAVLYHPETFVIVAVARSIDNEESVAARADEWQITVEQMTQTAEPARTDPGAGGCGPYSPNQWVKASDYDQSGLDLPIDTSELVGTITDYECIVPETGTPYLKAWTVMRSRPAPDASKSGKSGDSEDDGETDDGGRPNVGPGWRLVRDEGGGILRYSNGQGRCRLYNQLPGGGWDHYEFDCID